MAALAPHEEASGLLRLPVETRLHIYSYLIPRDRIDIDLCTPRRPDPVAEPPPHRVMNMNSSSTNATTAAAATATTTTMTTNLSSSSSSSSRTFSCYHPKQSPISGLVAQVIQLESITRTNGLHLLMVSRLIHDEVRSLLSKLAVRFHCLKCFEELLRNLSFGLGVGVRWMKHVEIIVNCGSGLFGPPFRPLTDTLAKFMVTEAMQAARRTVWLYYGRLDLKNKEKWEYEPCPLEKTSSSTTTTDPNSSSQAAQAQGQGQQAHQAYHGLPTVPVNPPQPGHFQMLGPYSTISVAGNVNFHHYIPNRPQQPAAPDRWLISAWFLI